MTVGGISSEQRSYTTAGRHTDHPHSSVGL